MDAYWTDCEEWFNLTMGYKTYKVVHAHSLDGKLLGEASHGDSIIYVEKTQNTTEKINTLLHEVVHCCLKIGGLSSLLEEEKLEESIVECVANMLTDTFKRNPELIQLLNDECKV